MISTGKATNHENHLKEDFSSLFQQLAAHSYSTALWRLPESNEIRIIAGHALRLNDAPELDKLPAGFLISPFINPELQHCYFISSDLVSASSSNPSELEEFCMQWNKKEESSKNYLHNYYNTHPATSDFNNTVKEAIAQIEAGIFKKVVLSRTKYIDLQEQPSPIESFFQLCDRFPNAFVSVVHLSSMGTWLGASPEKLVSMSKEGIFETIALAGTQVVSQEDLSKVTWGQKEIEEQALVSRYIINCFKTIRLREYEEEGPRTVRAGHLLHLQTNFKVDTKAVHMPELPSVMLRLLHPTSAICGMPKPEAMAFIAKHEGYQRELFSGFLGPINIESSTNLFVNLRCARLWKDRIQLFAGAGITRESDPERELFETEQKMKTIGDLFSAK